MSRSNKVIQISHKDLESKLWILSFRHLLGAIYIYTHIYIGFPRSSVGKESPAMQKNPVQFLGWEDPLEKE